MSPLLTIPEAAAVLRCSRARVFQLIADGTLQRGPRYGLRTVVTGESVEAALGQGLAPTPPRRRRTRRADFAEEINAAVAAFRAGA